MKKTLTRISITALGLLLVVILLFDPIASRLLRAKIFSALKTSCPACQLRIEKIHVSLLSSGLSAKNVDFKDDPAASTVVDISAKNLEAHFRLLSLFTKTPELTRLEAQGAHVIVSELANGPPSNHPAFPPPGAVMTPLPRAKVDGIVAHDSQFTYALTIHGKTGTIDLHDVEAKIGGFATRADLLKDGPAQRLKMSATAVLENSGKARVDVDLQPFAQKNDDKIEIELRDQNMSELNKFFGIEDGLTLSGRLEKGVARMSLSQGQLRGNLQAAYDGLNVKFHATTDRSKLSAFFSNFVRSLEVAKTKPKPGESRIPEAPIQTDRVPREAWTKVLLRGLKDAALKIITS